MPITPQFTPSDIEAFVAEKTRRLRVALLRELCAIGEACVNAAKLSHSNDWTDQTGNLRSSIGFAVAYNGELFSMSDFPVVLNGYQGSKNGKEFVQSLLQQNTKGAVLVVVAGMEYAKYVADRGFDVLTSSELCAERLVPEMLKKLGMST